jgi:hypothetical protein
MAALGLIGGAVVIWTVISAIGLILTHFLCKGSVHSADLGVDVWFAHHRTKTWDPGIPRRRDRQARARRHAPLPGVMR